ncbi:MAG: hypothetical protein K2Z81_12130 [Cyanobacteria bacterium]|nr:hypothetical protein [Cyanobacteriota bacterium]
MSRLEEKKQSYMQRVVGMAVLFGVLGAIVFCFAVNYISKVFKDALSGVHSSTVSTTDSAK